MFFFRSKYYLNEYSLHLVREIAGIVSFEFLSRII